MAYTQKYRNDIYRLLLLFTIFILVRLLFIILMPHTYSKDLYAWLNVIDILKNEGNPYSVTGVLNWPPFWMQVLYGVHIISKFTAVSPTLIIQLVLIGGEAMTLLACYLVLRKFFNVQKPAKVLIFGVALNPVCILLSCQHCNFDVFVGFWVLLFVAALLLFYTGHSPVNWLIACFFLGIGILTKTVPVILSPLLAIGIRNQKFTTIFFGLMLLFTPVAIGMSIIFSLGHTGVINHVISYRSMSGWYGFTGILGLLKTDALIDLYRKLSPIIISGSLLYLTWWGYHTQILKPKRLIIISLLFLIAIPTFGPGYSPPYINWYFPLAVILYCISSRGLKNFLALGYAVLALTYITEYAFFDSHGAFLTKFFPSAKMSGLSDMLGSQKMQVLIRLPMFVFYISLFVLLVSAMFTSGKSHGEATV
ncbi:MAG: hypothetical protein ACHQD8_02505 [Chitinophagales bacterium]